MSRPSPRARRHGEQGFTLVEMMMALLLVGIVMVPLTRVFVAGSGVDLLTGQRTNAEQVATRALEAIRAVPYNSAVAPNAYDMVGFFSDETFPTGYSSWYQSPTWVNNGSGTNPAGPLQMITLGSCSTSCYPGFTPIQPQSTCPAPVGQAASDCPTGVVYSGTTYTITRYIYWLSSTGYVYPTSTTPAPLTTFADAYKGITVTVQWTDKTGNHTLQQDSVMYPGGLGRCTTPTNCSGTTTTSTTAPAGVPGQPVLSVASVGPSSVSLSWPTPGGGTPSGYVLQYSTTAPAGQSLVNPVTVTPAPSATTTSYTVSGLAPTQYWFQLTATNGAGSSTPSAPAGPAQPTGSSTTTTTTTVPGTTTTVPGTTTTTTTTTSTTLAPCSIAGITVSPSKIYENQQGHSGKSTTDLSQQFTVAVQVATACSQVLQVNSAGTHSSGTADPGSPYLLSGPGGNGVGQWTYQLPSSSMSNWSQDTHVMTLSINGTATSNTAQLLVCGYTASQSSGQTTC